MPVFMLANPAHVSTPDGKAKASPLKEAPPNASVNSAYPALNSFSFEKEEELKSKKKRQTKKRNTPITNTLIFINYSYVQTLL